ncbi:hypothetical protein FHX16_005508, partial [Rhizobium sp. BK661]|nr:hypothetical protein [Rhizobium sp. BK661]
SSMCWSMVIVVSVTDVTDDGGRQGGESQVKARMRPAEPACGGTSFVAA